MLDPGSNRELPPIPAKRYFTIGEVSELCDVKPHVLRYWETEFPSLEPAKMHQAIVGRNKHAGDGGGLHGTQPRGARHHHPSQGRDMRAQAPVRHGHHILAD